MLRRRLSGQRGASTVELAFVAPLLLLLAFGVIDIGRVLYTYVAVQEAAQEGAIYGSYHPDDLAGVKGRVIDSTTYPRFTQGDIVVTCPTGSNGRPRIRVETTHRIGLLTPVLLSPNVTMSRSYEGEIFSDDACVAG